MLKTYRIIPVVFILCLFGLTLITVPPVFAADGDGFTVCDNMPEAASKLSCFRDLARSLRAAVEDMTTAASSQEAAVDKAEGNKRATDAFIDAQAENEEYLKSELKRMKAELEAANSASAEHIKPLTLCKALLELTADKRDELQAAIDKAEEEQTALTAKSKCEQGRIEAMCIEDLDPDIKTCIALAPLARGFSGIRPD
jgi:chromosome segregation ATPase